MERNFYDVFSISGNPSVSATHCQLSTRQALQAPHTNAYHAKHSRGHRGKHFFSTTKHLG